MVIEWAGLGPELLLRLDRTLAEPLRAQLERELRDAIRSGRLAAGERLPSSRAMAAELGISRGLVLECYSQLQAEGFLTSRNGSATRVAAGALTPSPPRAKPVLPQRPAVDFRPGVPDLTSFPRRDWAWALRESCRDATPADLGYGDPRGSEALRRVLAGYLRRVRGGLADAEQIVICAGFGQGINLVLRSLALDGVQRVAIEDDYDAEFRYDRDPIGALQGLAPDRVALIGTVSKSLAPALRLGWVVCPGGLLESLTEDKRLSDRGSATLEQLALAALIESGRYDRHLRHMRGVYAARRDTLIESLAKHAPDVVLHGLAAGFHAVAHLADDKDEHAIVEQARSRSIGLYGMSAYRPSGRSGPPQLVLGFGNLSEPAIERGIATISDLI